MIRVIPKMDLGVENGIYILRRKSLVSIYVFSCKINNTGYIIVKLYI